MKQILITHAHVETMHGAAIENGYVLLQDDKIAAVGTADALPQAANAQVIDAQGAWLMPGLIDVHSHIGLIEDALGLEGEDVNEDTDPITPQLRVIDGINPRERAFAEAYAAGVTSVIISPGSANAIGGQLAAIKTFGRRIDDMIIRAPLAIKFALGENPKSVYREREETPVTRMATAALIREQLTKAREYAQHKLQAVSDPETDEPDFDAKLDALVPLMNGEIPAHFHVHRADDIFTALRIAKEFQLRTVLIHGTEAHLIADILAQEQVPVVSGPFMTDRSKPELANLTDAAPAILVQHGILTAISTDHPEFPEKYLMQAAALAVRAGMPEHAALRAITIDAARIAGLEQQIGSIAVGKDADLVLFSGEPLDFRSKVKMVFCNGQCVFTEE